MQALINLYETFGEALHTVQELEAANVPPEAISLLVLNGKFEASDDVSPPSKKTKPVTDGEPLVDDKRIQGIRTKFYAGMQVQLLPGLEPLAAGGWLVAGALDHTPDSDKGLSSPPPSGLIMCLLDHGVDKAHAEAYIEGIRHGSALLGVRPASALKDVVERIMREDHMPLDPHKRGKHYETGRFNPDEFARVKRAERALAMLIAGTQKN